MARRGQPNLPTSRRAMLGVYAGLYPELRASLAALRITFDDTLDPFDQLTRAVEGREEAQPGTPQADIPRVQLAQAAMELLERQPERANTRGLLDPVLAQLVDPRLKANADAAQTMFDVLRAGVERRRDRSLPVAERRLALDDAEVQAAAHPDLLRITVPTITSEPRLFGDKYVARVQTRFQVRDPERDGLDVIAPKTVPDQWPAHNSFFCNLSRAPGLDFDHPGATGGNLLPSARLWRGVFHEQVGDCPADWFPGTFLLFTWVRSQSQLVLSYELVKPPAGIEPVITVDEGYIQIDQLADRYEVTTVKHILFRDPPFPGGGQALAEFAPTFGWLDHAINWFSDSPSGSAARPQGVPLAPAVAGQDAHLQAVLDDCERDGQELLADVDEQVGSSLAKIKAGTYGLNDYVGDWARATDRAITAGARSLSHQIALGKGWLDLAKTLTGREDKA